MSATLTSELAGLATAVLWACSAMCWSVLGRRRRIAPTAMATMRLVIASTLLFAGHALFYGRIWPAGVSPEALALLALSGVAGAGVGDILYFRSLMLIGPRLSMTLASLAPVVAALLAWLPPMRERLDWRGGAGMALALGGVIWVVSEKRGREAWPTTPDGYWRGVAASILSVLVTAVAFLCSRAGMLGGGGEPVPAYSATCIRVAAAAVFCWALAALRGRLRATVEPFRDRVNLGWLALGSVLGTVIGISLSMVALRGAATGVAATLISMSPLALIPMTWAAYGERPTWGRVAATVVAMGGIGLLMLSGR
jgi:drug/metabolite transporter (DMT)-like permease